jgi:hypothetical protein
MASFRPFPCSDGAQIKSDYFPRSPGLFSARDARRLYLDGIIFEKNAHESLIVFAGAGAGVAQGSSRMSTELTGFDRDETERILLDFMLAHLWQLAQANLDYTAVEKIIAKLPDRNSVSFFFWATWPPAPVAKARDQCSGGDLLEQDMSLTVDHRDVLG